MKNVFIVLIIVVGLVFITLAYVNLQKAKTTANLDSINAQTDLINAQTQQQEQCKNNWLCATTSVLDSSSGILGGALSIFGI